MQGPAHPSRGWRPSIPCRRKARRSLPQTSARPRSEIWTVHRSGGPMHLKGHQKNFQRNPLNFKKKADLQRFFSNHLATWQWPFPTRAPKSLHLKVSRMQALTCHSDSYMARTRPPSPSPILSYPGDRASPQKIFPLNSEYVHLWTKKKCTGKLGCQVLGCWIVLLLSFFLVVWPFNGTPWALVEGFFFEFLHPQVTRIDPTLPPTQLAFGRSFLPSPSSRKIRIICT